MLLAESMHESEHAKTMWMKAAGARRAFCSKSGPGLDEFFTLASAIGWSSSPAHLTHRFSVCRGWDFVTIFLTWWKVLRLSWPKAPCWWRICISSR